MLLSLFAASTSLKWPRSVIRKPDLVFLGDFGFLDEGIFMVSLESESSNEPFSVRFVFTEVQFFLDRLPSVNCSQTVAAMRSANVSNIAQNISISLFAPSVYSVMVQSCDQNGHFADYSVVLTLNSANFYADSRDQGSLIVLLFTDLAFVGFLTAWYYGRKMCQAPESTATYWVTAVIVYNILYHCMHLIVFLIAMLNDVSVICFEVLTGLAIFAKVQLLAGAVVAGGAWAALPFGGPFIGGSIVFVYSALTTVLLEYDFPFSSFHFAFIAAPVNLLGQMIITTVLMVKLSGARARVGACSLWLTLTSFAIWLPEAVISFSVAGRRRIHDPLFGTWFAEEIILMVLIIVACWPRRAAPPVRAPSPTGDSASQIALPMNNYTDIEISWAITE
jgi:hypothetical protein